ncbi:MAG: UDP-3-O-(3-hydroxymyristoyl)glucosamine N-acyltransferase [marine bacterium B5-7]|nr:MAG: UDP-3-O-(3-hydroxymyristoyl)glucosamine N-acyltransferase [marine bacterium B5-7]
MAEQREPLTLADIAASIGGDVDGRSDIPIERPASLSRAGPLDISFFTDHRLKNALVSTAAGAVILSPADRHLFSGACLITDEPYLSFVECCELLINQGLSNRGVHPGAHVHVEAVLGSGVSVDAGAVIGRGVRIGQDAQIGANSYIGDYTVIGANSRIAAGVSIYDRCQIGDRCNIASNTVIGSPGFGYLETASGWKAIPQIGSVIIGDDVDIGAGTMIDRGSLDDTVIGNGCKLDNLIQIAHNVTIGENTAIAGFAGIAGSTRVGSGCKIGGRASINGHIEIADEVVVLATSLVTGSLLTKGVYGSHLPVQPAGRWRRIVARLTNIDDLFRRVRSLEKKIGSEDTSE